MDKYCFERTRNPVEHTQPARASRSSSMDDEWEEEEQLVVVELSGIINNDFLSKCRGTCKILDIDSEKPMMQVGQYVFAGEYEDALGTCVLFEEGPQKGKADTSPELKYTCHTVKKLMMQRIFLTEKKEGETSTGSGDSAEQSDVTCLSNQEESVNQQGESEEDIDNTDLEDSAVG
ncbi:general transcription factor 3C polypeptide 6 isoform X2 [Larimichthys crocea]|uniref:general transcription factor 3C polypeptide 6 isoform X2 n=1 Tax=Larimichthys crocea TaxID=215358 RepID=UPI000F5FE66B|nr:general transcription factor 3C polypeptide 6 isoform X2 [Larimichthys crocea]